MSDCQRKILLSVLAGKKECMVREKLCCAFLYTAILGVAPPPVRSATELIYIDLRSCGMDSNNAHTLTTSKLKKYARARNAMSRLNLLKVQNLQFVRGCSNHRCQTAFLYTFISGVMLSKHRWD